MAWSDIARALNRVSTAQKRGSINTYDIVLPALSQDGKSAFMEIGDIRQWEGDAKQRNSTSGQKSSSTQEPMQ
ncbi:2818_t:CDS:2, partial [Acaulospora colombiana]